MKLDEIPDVLLVALIVGGLSIVSILLHKLEGLLEARGMLRLARCLGALRAFLTTDAPTVAARLASAAKGRPVAVTLPALQAKDEAPPPVVVEKPKDEAQP